MPCEMCDGLNGIRRKLDKDNISKREGITNKRCRSCLSKNVRKYNQKRKKALAGSKWF